MDIAKIWNDTEEDLTGISDPEGASRGNDCVTFNHLNGGYDVGYFSYLW